MAIQMEGLVEAAKQLVGTHGIFYAACLLADHGVPLPVALIALCGSAKSHQRILHRVELDGGDYHVSLGVDN